VEVAATADSNQIASSQLPQHLQALERANRVRLARAALKRSIASGEVSITKVITECPWQTESMTLSELLRAQSRWGRTRTRKLLASVGLSENKRLDTLTERQRMLLVSSAPTSNAPSGLGRSQMVTRRPRHRSMVGPASVFKGTSGSGS
jgi:hypothetical protein